ncbi:DUF4097 domain-containing protein [Paenibacillus yanchengensis]
MIGLITLAYFLKSSLTHPVLVEKHFNSDAAQSLVIESINTNIEIRKSLSSTATVQLIGKSSHLSSDELDISFDDTTETITISTGSNNYLRSFFSFSFLKLIIDLPEKHWSSVRIKATSGNITMNNCQATNIQVKSISGNVIATHMDSSQLSVDVLSGNIKLDDINNTLTSLHTKSGNIKAARLQTNNLQFAAVSGNVHISGGSMGIDGDAKSGNIKLLLDQIIHHSTLSAKSGNIMLSLLSPSQHLAVDYAGRSGIGKVHKDGFIVRHKNDHRNEIRGLFGNGTTSLIVQTSSGNFTLQ